MVVAFDLDDTLFRELDFVDSSYVAISRILEAENVIPAAEALSIMRSSLSQRQAFDNLAAHIIGYKGKKDFTASGFVEIYRSHYPSISLRPGARKMLEELKQQGIQLAIITDGRSLTQRHKFDSLELGRWINPCNLLISEEVGGDKTTPIPFQSAERLFPSEKSFVYVGDNPSKDFFWPNSMGWFTVQICNSPGYAVHLPAENLALAYLPQASIEDLAQLPKSLLSLQNQECVPKVSPLLS